MRRQLGNCVDAKPMTEAVMSLWRQLGEGGRSACGRSEARSDAIMHLQLIANMLSRLLGQGVDSG